MKRQRGRNRGGGGSSSSGGGGKQPQNANRAFDSNGPEGVKVRGNAQHVFEKYQQLARDTGAAGDRVLAENYLQHAEHYFRLLRAMQPTRPASEILGRDHFSSGFDIDFEDEGVQAQAEAADEAAAAAAEAAGPAGVEAPQDAESRDRNGWQQQNRDDRPRDDRNRGVGEQRFEGRRDETAGGGGGGETRQGRRDRWREDRPRDDRPRAADDRPRDDRPRDDRPRDDRPRDERPRDERPRDERPRDDRPRYDRDDRRDRPERDPMPVVEPQAQPLVTAEERSSPVLRDSDGGESHAPAFLQARTEPRAETTAEEKPRRPRRRAPRTFDAGDGAPPSSGETEDA